MYCPFFNVKDPDCKLCYRYVSEYDSCVDVAIYKELHKIAEGDAVVDADLRLLLQRLLKYIDKTEGNADLRFLL